jgi:hypothetical protein
MTELRAALRTESMRGSAKVRGKTFQVTGLGNREPGTGVQVWAQVKDLNFPHLHLYLITCTRDLRAETWDPKMFSLR